MASYQNLPRQCPHQKNDKLCPSCQRLHETEKHLLACNHPTEKSLQQTTTATVANIRLTQIFSSSSGLVSNLLDAPTPSTLQNNTSIHPNYLHKSTTDWMEPALLQMLLHQMGNSTINLIPKNQPNQTAYQNPRNNMDADTQTMGSKESRPTSPH